MYETFNYSYYYTCYQEFCTKPEEGKPEICTRLVVTEAKPEKQSW
jgi:hypothetical protein